MNHRFTGVFSFPWEHDRGMFSLTDADRGQAWPHRRLCAAFAHGVVILKRNILRSACRRHGFEQMERASSHGMMQQPAPEETAFHHSDAVHRRMIAQSLEKQSNRINNTVLAVEVNRATQADERGMGSQQWIAGGSAWVATALKPRCTLTREAMHRFDSV
ncbi:hypothetical protein [Variovorax paradoxus]|uniref:hypothetical protein n=1 Tax=Variovorax paradoxus TaxID=34073 RepID=UPI003ED14D78